jgi:LPPG:FO 2-phospho-L-lactate transferase
VNVVILSGGTGGAKLARGLYDMVGDGLTVIANTGDDIEIHGAHVSPDPDLIAYWLADMIDERGWGIAGDTFTEMDRLRAAGTDVWFNLGDRDLAFCVERARLLAAGRTPSYALARMCASLGVSAGVVPMCEQQVRTEIDTGTGVSTGTGAGAGAGAGGGWIGLQDFLIRARGEAPIAGVRFAGADAATVCPAAAEALAAAEAIVIGPSNPVISIGPILAVPGMREALAGAAAPVVAVSPIVDGTVLKGPTAAFLAWAGVELDAAGLAACYAGVIDGLVTDETTAAIASHETDVLMAGAAGRRRLAEETVAFCRRLAE